MTKKKYQVGDRVKTFFQKKGSRKKIEVVGEIKSIKQEFGQPTYVISNGSIGEFRARNVFND